MRKLMCALALDCPPVKWLAMFGVATLGALGLGDFVAVVDEWRAGPQEQPGGLRAQLIRTAGEKAAGSVCRQVMIAHEGSQPAMGGYPLVGQVHRVVHVSFKGLERNDRSVDLEAKPKVDDVA